MDEVLPGGTVTVLLVEPDDATRNVVAAHLKKCRYTVITAADGLKAWEIVKGKEQLIDLILAETELPLMSGLTLIALIMEDESCKNIPVIMMSARDSVNTVYSYLRKGASDFLVKPIRRNELSNLWQHVWRRRNMTNGCGCGTEERQTVSSSQQNSKYDSAKNIAGNHSKENSDSISRIMEHNDNEGDTQNSSKGSEMEVGIICKNNIINSPKVSVDSEFVTPEEAESIKFENVLPLHYEARVKSIGLISGYSPFNQDNGEQTSKGSSSAEIFHEHNGVTSFDCNDGYGTEGSPDPNNSSVKISLGPSNGKIRKIRQKTGCIIEDGVSNNFSMLSNTNNQLELSLGRPHHHSNFDMHDCSLQNHSRKSAFSRYCGKYIQPMLLTPENHEGEKEKASYGSHGNHLHQYVNSTGTLSEATQSSAISSSNEDGKAATCLKEAGIGNIPFSFLATTNNIFFPQCHTSKLQEQSLCMNPAIHETLHPNPSNTHGSIYLESERFKDQTEIHHDDIKLKNAQSAEDTNNLSSSVTGQSSSSSVNGFESHFNGTGCVNNIICSRITAENNNDDKLFTHHSNRTAALQRYKLKRSRRAYGKKVRYHNRKILAEQRPRVKGQFVRQGQGDIRSLEVDRKNQ